MRSSLWALPASALILPHMSASPEGWRLLRRRYRPLFGGLLQNLQNLARAGLQNYLRWVPPRGWEQRGPGRGPQQNFRDQALSKCWTLRLRNAYEHAPVWSRNNPVQEVVCLLHRFSHRGSHRPDNLPKSTQQLQLTAALTPGTRFVHCPVLPLSEEGYNVQRPKTPTKMPSIGE